MNDEWRLQIDFLDDGPLDARSWPDTYSKVYGPFAFLGGLVN